MVSVCPRNYRRCLSQHSSSKNDRYEVVAPYSDIMQMETDILHNQRTWSPRHSVTRRTAKITREVQCAWNTKLGATAPVVPAEKLLQLFNDVQIYPTHAQVNEMLHCAQKCAGRNSARYLTFSEFCIFATELKRSVHCRIRKREYFSRLLQQDGLNRNSKRSISKMSDPPLAEVFLGGSCNPTTWRKDVAIPILQKFGVTFFNPQVADWSPEMIELEHKAKQNAEVLLYVIDNQTRNVVSFIEAANFLGSRRKVIIAINSFKGPGHVIASEKISSEEFNDLSTSLCLFKQLTERRNVPIFSKVNDAVAYAADLLKGSSKLKVELKNGQKLIKMKEAFESLDLDKCGLINSTDICKGLRLLSHKRSHSTELTRNILQNIDEHNSGRNNVGIKVNFEQFCKIVSELNINGDKHSNGKFYANSNGTKFFRSLSSPDAKPTFTSSEDKIPVTDIYLGGDCGADLIWRQNIAIPIIRNACLTFYNPENERRINQKLPPSELAVINNSTVLLFVINNSSRSLFTMILASYYLGVGANMVLCIQQLPDQCIVGSDELSQIALKDYNRGRLYLADMAKRQNVPIFESIQDAVKAAIDKCVG